MKMRSPAFNALMSLVLMAGADVAAAKKKKARVAPPSIQEAIGRVLDGRGEAISDCVMKNAVNKGAAKVDVSAHLLINNHGQLFECSLTVKTDKGDGALLTTCVEQALKAVAYPKSASPLISVDRAWHFTTQ